MGITCWDRIARVGQRRDKDLWRIEERYETVGGNAPNAAATAAMIEEEVVLLSALGADDYGSRIKELWQGIPSLDVIVETVPRTAISDLMIFPERRQIYSDRPQFTIRPSSVYQQLVSRAKIIDFYPGLFLEDIAEWYSYMQGALRVRSLSGIEEEVRSGRTWQILVDSLDIAQAPEEDLLRALKTELLVLTEASRGGRLWTPVDGWRRFRTLSVEEVDSIGAGDAFRGALLVALRRGAHPDQAVQFAAKYGARAAARRGGFPGKEVTLPLEDGV